MKYLFLACGMAALFAACQNENEPKVVSDKPGTSGDYRIIIEGEETDAQPSRSSGTIQFVGGTASGAGLYDGTAKAIVSATPDPGYEINYFYGGPDSQPKKYDNANGGASTFDVSIEGQDHLFHVGFKKKTGLLTINAGTGGKVSPNGENTIQREVPFSIKAIPDNGYEFAGWTVNNGSVTIENANSTSTTATLNSASGTITAQFKQKAIPITITYYSDYFITSSTSNISLSMQFLYRCIYRWGRDDGESGSKVYWVTIDDGEKFPESEDYDDGYGNYESRHYWIDKITINVNNEIVYQSSSTEGVDADTPKDGEIINGYQYFIIRK